MFDKAFKISVCFCFVLILMVKMSIPATAVFVGHFSKQIKPVLMPDQEKDDEKSSDSKEDFSKTKKNTDEVLVSIYEFTPTINQVNLLYRQQKDLFKQTHFPAILTPPPNAICFIL